MGYLGRDMGGRVEVTGGLSRSVTSEVITSYVLLWLNVEC